MPECSCGTEIKAKNSAGHYRDKCSECLTEVAESRTPHVLSCESWPCQVCLSKLEEIQSVIQPLHLEILSERRTDDENKTLDQYT